MPVITKSTRVTYHSATLIDNIFVDNSLDYRAGMLSSDISDHYPIFIMIRSYFSATNRDNVIKITYRVITEHTMLLLRQLMLATDFTGMMQEANIDDSFNLLSECLHDAYNIACPIVNKTLSTKRIR